MSVSGLVSLRHLEVVEYGNEFFEMQNDKVVTEETLEDIDELHDAEDCETEFDHQCVRTYLAFCKLVLARKLNDGGYAMPPHKSTVSKGSRLEELAIVSAKGWASAGVA